MSLSAEIAAALAEAGSATGGAPLLATFTRRAGGAVAPWETGGPT